MSISEASASPTIVLDGNTPAGGVPAVLKCLAILRLLDRRGGAGASLAVVAGELGITKSHCLSILRTLLAARWIRHDAHRHSYVLDAGLLDDLPNLVRDQDRSGRLHRILIELSRATRVPCVLTRINPDGSFIAIEKAEEGAELLVSVPIGHRFPSDAPAQFRTHLAFGDPDATERLLDRWAPQAFTARTILDRETLMAEVEATRKRGYTVSRSEYTLGVMSIAVPVFDHGDRMRMVLQSPGLEADLETREWQVAEAMRRAAGLLRAVI